MNSRHFYWVVAVVLCFFFAYPLLRMVVEDVTWLPLIQLSRFKTILAVAIVIHETNRATRIVSAISYVLLFAGLAGLLMWTMRWPWGEQLFIGSGVGVFCLLLASALRNSTRRTDRLMVLIYPLSRFVFTLAAIYNVEFYFGVADMTVSAGLGGYLLVRLLRFRHRETANVLDNGHEEEPN